MKLKILSMLITLAVLAVMPMIYMGKFDPVSIVNSAVSSGATEFSTLKAQVPANLGNAITDEKIQVYKWRDKNGVMQFSGAPPATVSNAEQVMLDPDSNLVQAVKMPEKAQAKTAETESRNPYSMKGMKKVMDDARGVEGLLQKRHEEQQKVYNNL